MANNYTALYVALQFAPKYQNSGHRLLIMANALCSETVQWERVVLYAGIIN